MIKTAVSLRRARQLASSGNDEAAKAAYLDVLRLEPANFDALNELAGLAYAGGFRSAARTAYEQAVRCHAANPVARVNLANLLLEDGDLVAARSHYEAALAADAEFAQAHQGLARVLAALGCTEQAAPHWQRGFRGHAIVQRPYRGTGNGIPVLLLVSAVGGNIPTQLLLDDRTFAVSALYTDYFDPTQPLPAHALVFNAIGDADLCADALSGADAVLARTSAPIINRPDAVRPTSRAANARRLAALAGVVTPQTRLLRREAVMALHDGFPLLLRAPGFHTGQHFVRVEGRDDVPSAMSKLPGEELLAIEYLDARGPDGMARKYRVMMIDGALYPMHLAISQDWKVHYFTAAMAGNADHREEERRFLEDMPAVLGPRAMAALAAIARTLGLEYAGVDFALRSDGTVLLFEANATMVINPPEPGSMWDYRRPAIDRVLKAVRVMLTAWGSAARSVP